MRWGMKKKPAKIKKPRVKYPTDVLKRINATVQIKGAEKPLSCRVWLGDLRPRQASIFVGEAIPVGQEVFLAIDFPRPLFVLARVEQCTLFALHTAVMSSANYHYRLQLSLVIESEKERQDVDAYFKVLYGKGHGRGESGGEAPPGESSDKKPAAA